MLLATREVCRSILEVTIANSVDPDQIAPYGAI